MPSHIKPLNAYILFGTGAAVTLFIYELPIYIHIVYYLVSYKVSKIRRGTIAGI